MQQYRHLFRTGCGFTEIILSLDDTSSLQFDSDWMGQGKTSFSATFKLTKISSSYGLLQLTKLSGSLCLPQFFIDSMDEGEFITFEYYLLNSQENIQIDPALEMMKLFGKGEWNQNFDLLLTLSSAYSQLTFEKEFEEAEFIFSLLCLDKIKFEKVRH